MQSEDRTPSLSQNQRMRYLSIQRLLDMDTIFKIMTEEKPNQKEHIKIKAENLQKFFPQSYNPKQMEKMIMKLLDSWQRQRQRNQDSRKKSVD